MAGHSFSIHTVSCQPWESGHIGICHYLARINQVAAVPFIGIAATHTSQIRTGTLGTPLERVVVHRFTGHRIMAIALGFSTEGADHLGVAVVAAFTDINISASHLKRSIRLDAWDGLGDGWTEKQRYNLNKQPNTDQQKGEYNQVAYFFFGKFLQLHFGSLFLISIDFIALVLLVLCESRNSSIHRLACYCSAVNVVCHQYHTHQIQQTTG